MEIVVRGCEIVAQIHKEGRAFANGDCGEELRDWGANALPLRHCYKIVVSVMNYSRKIYGRV